MNIEKRKESIIKAIEELIIKDTITWIIQQFRLILFKPLKLNDL